jgi:hypothetical protein
MAVSSCTVLGAWLTAGIWRMPLSACMHAQLLSSCLPSLSPVFPPICSVEETSEGWCTLRLRAPQGHGDMKRACQPNAGVRRAGRRRWPAVLCDKSACRHPGVSPACWCCVCLCVCVHTCMELVAPGLLHV